MYERTVVPAAGSPDHHPRRRDGRSIAPALTVGLLALAVGFGALCVLGIILLNCL